MSTPLTDAINALTTYANSVTGASDTTLSDAVDTLAAGYGGGSSGPAFEMIGQWTGYLPEYTNTSTVETTDTGIDITSTDYACILTVITCDGTYTNNNDWGGLAINLSGRYKNNGKLYALATLAQRRTQSLTLAGMVDGSQSYSSYGVFLSSNVANIQLGRKAHATSCPKLMAGNYTVKAYGLTAL
jgi:hypothetical protein